MGFQFLFPCISTYSVITKGERAIALFLLVELKTR